MHIIQILLPVADNAGEPFPASLLKGIHDELTLRFGGLTAYTRAPAQGTWIADRRRERDDIVVVEVMAHGLERDWWSIFRLRVEQLLRQERLVVRAFPIEML